MTLRFKKLICFCLVLLMFVTVFVGCGKDKGTMYEGNDFKNLAEMVWRKGSLETRISSKL